MLTRCFLIRSRQLGFSRKLSIATMALSPKVKCMFHKDTNTAQYVVIDEQSGKCALIDTVLDFDIASCRTSTKSADELLQYVQTEGLTVEHILETHVHADHLSAADYIKKKTNAPVGIGSEISVVQKTFVGLYNLHGEVATDGSQFDNLWKDGSSFSIGHIPVRVYHTPGHTPACVSYHIGNALFCGDTIFMPDFGSARCDFPGGSAHTLYGSVHKILALPEDTRVFVGHDYPPAGGRDVATETTVGAELRENKHIRAGVSESDFVELREGRDKTMTVPRLMLYALQVNIRAGALPPVEPGSGTAYLKLPLNKV
eukprot:TRINITY_DN7146_c0_g1_i1.p1 TRINITY_DN7146_c0_g1~~TRINITY_DN7146_c0_g1_i1.p1  ORF type:complete len:314 (+),score=38.33 TRINITY_DN7146_c0_g1_i1:49-990(+)